MVLLVNMAVLHKRGSRRARVTSRIFLIGVVIWGPVKILAGEIVLACYKVKQWGSLGAQQIVVVKKK